MRASRGLCLGQSFRPGAEAGQCPRPSGDALGAVDASLRPVCREAECPVCVWGVALSGPTGPGDPVVAGVAPSGAGLRSWPASCIHGALVNTGRS